MNFSLFINFGTWTHLVGNLKKSLDCFLLWFSSTLYFEEIYLAKETFLHRWTSEKHEELLITIKRRCKRENFQFWENKAKHTMESAHKSFRFTLYYDHSSRSTATWQMKKSNKKLTNMQSELAYNPDNYYCIKRRAVQEVWCLWYAKWLSATWRTLFVK